MTPKTSKLIEDAYAEATGLSKKVLEYSLTFKRITTEAKQADRALSLDDWEPLAALVDIDNFERIGHLKEVMNWAQYTQMISEHAAAMIWDGSYRRITEVDGVVFLELEERGAAAADGSNAFIVNTLTVYEFNDAGKLVHLDIYLQGGS